jgi:TetR/AcrR family transcriptional repressor of lmrAB and yxaGH operons
MGARTDTRKRMVRAGAELLAEKGYAATGMLDVVAAAEASRGSIYFHFPDGKDQLVVEALDLSTGRALERAAAAVQGSTSTGEVIERTGAYLAAVLEATDYRMGCPVATVALEVANTDNPVLDTCRSFFDRWRSIYVGSLLRDGATPVDAEQLATMIVSVVEGGLMLARTTSNTRPLLDACAAAAALIDRSIPVPPTEETP